MSTNNNNINTNNNHQKMIKESFSLLIQGLKKIHTLIMKSWHPVKIYSILSIVFLYIVNMWTINYMIYRSYNNTIYNYKVGNLEASLQKAISQTQENGKDLEETIKNNLVTNIEKVIKSEKEQCIQQNTLQYIKDLNSHSDVYIYPSEDELKKKSDELSSWTCSVENLPDPYLTLLKEVFGENSKVVVDYTSSVKKGETPEIKSEIKTELDQVKNQIIEEEKVQRANLTTINMDTTKTVSPQPIKAIFCSAWHGKGKGGGYDPGAPATNQTREQNKLTERDLIMKTMPSVCKTLEKNLKDKGIKVYSIGMDTERTLVDRINIINNISKENGYTKDNSIGVELHYNSVGDERRSWVEVLYSQNKPDIGLNFSTNLLNDIKPIYHNNQNFMKMTNDKDSRYKRLGIVSDTIPNMVILEYGFMSNPDDVTWALDNMKKAQDTLVKSIMEYTNN